MNEYMEIYIAEAKELLDEMNGSLLKLDKNLADTSLINSIFRDIHTIKGNSAGMGFKKMENLSHSMEDVLQDIREGKVEVDTKIMELLFVCHDFLESGINSIMQTGSEEEMKIDGILSKLHLIIGEKHEKMKSEVASPLEKTLDLIDLTLNTQELYDLKKSMDLGLKAYLIKIRLINSCIFKSVRVWMWFHEMDAFLSIIKSDPEKPSPGDIKNNTFSFEGSDVKLLAVTREDTQSLLGKLNQLLDMENVYVEPVKLKDTDFMKSQIKLVMTGAAISSNSAEEEAEQETGEEADKAKARLIEIESEFSEDFKNEIEEQLAKLDAGIEQLKEKPENNNLCYKLSRVFHTVKGLAGFIDHKSILSVADAAEQLMEFYRKENPGAANIKTDLLTQASTLMKKLCQRQAGSNSELQASVSRHLDQMREELNQKANNIQEQNNQKPENLEYKKNEADFADQGKTELGNRRPDQVHTEPKNTVAEKKTGSSQEQSQEETKNSADHEKAEKPAQDISLKDLHQLAEKETLNNKGNTLENSFMRISAQKIDVLVDMLGELIIMHSLVLKEASDRFDSNDTYMNNLQRMSKIIKEVQNLSMSLRMVSLKQTLQKTMRVGRDTAAELGKKVDIQIKGEETEIDRNIADKLVDPLMHLIRNSISHGVESEEERSKKGKPSTGQVNIRAYSKRGYVYIEVEDDGKGLSPEKIRAKAAENNLIDPNSNYSNEEVMKFIFLPGFSTKEVVDNISGRGVGMNIVETEIKKVGGKVDILNREGQGCTFVLKIPLNLAVMNGTIVEILGDRYIIPTVYIKQFLKPEENQWVSVKNKKTMLQVRNEILQVIPIDKVFGMEDYPQRPEEGLVIIIEVEQKLKAIPVTGILGRQEIVAKPLDKELAGLDFISGASILGDGKVSLILDVESIFKYNNIS